MTNLQTQSGELPQIHTKGLDRTSQQVLLYILNKPKTFKYYNNEDKQKLGAYLVAIAKFLGVREPLDDVQRKMLVRCLINEMSDFTLEELDKAIQMGAMGKLQVDNKHYGCITPMYLSDIISAYKNHRGSVYKIYKQNLASEERSKPSIKPTEKEELNSAMKLLEVEYKDYIANPDEYKESDFRYTQYKFIYKFLLKFNIVESINYTSDKDLKSYIINVFNKIKNSGLDIRGWLNQTYIQNR